MGKQGIYQLFTDRKAAGKKSFAVLIDPDKADENALRQTVELCAANKVHFIFVGGSLVTGGNLEQTVATIKKHSNIPVVLFPGSPAQVTPAADALLYLSLISGRNPDMLIGQHVISAPFIKQSGIEVMSTGYMVVDGGAPTTVSYISNAAPLPANKPEIAMCTAMAGEMLGMKLIYMDAGSGASKAITTEMISRVGGAITVPLIVGGGITSAEKAFENCSAGADVIVIGNAIEKDPELIRDIAAVFTKFQEPA